MDSLTDEQIRDLILSVGTHKKSRKLSPIEVAKYINIAQESGIPKNELASMLQLNSTSIFSKFTNLLKLNPDVQNLVDWGNNSATISFTSADLMSRLPHAEQQKITPEIIKNKLNKSEIRQIVQIWERSEKDIQTSLNEVLNQRPIIEKQYLFIGYIDNERLIDKLRQLKQYQRDSLLADILNKEINPKMKFNCRLGANNFSLAGDETFSKNIKLINPDFETAIINWLKECLEIE